MSRILTVAVSIGAVLYAFATLAVRTPDRRDAASSVAASSFKDGAPSVESLMDDMLRAIEAKDEAALHRLRVDREEYATVVVPGTVEKGAPPRVIREATTNVFWRLLDAKSRDLGRVILAEFGGHTLRPTALVYTKGVKEYGGYTAYGEVRLSVVDENGQPGQLRSGTIAAVAGRYKFIGLNWND